MKDLTNIFKILSDNARLRILMLLYCEELCVCQIEGVLNMSQPSVSKNLAKLRDLDMVCDKRRQKFVYYTLNLECVFLVEVLTSINRCIKQYPQLVADRKAIVLKDQFSNNCKG